MTVNVVVRVNDGVVLAADGISAVPGGSRVYGQATKVAALCPGLPLGMVSAGALTVGGLGVGVHLGDLRRRLTGDDPDHPDWRMDPAACSVGEAARRVAAFVYEREADANPDDPGAFSWDCTVAGYSSGQLLPEVWAIDRRRAGDPVPVSRRYENALAVSGDGQAPIFRLLQGFDLGLEEELRRTGAVPEDRLAGVMEALRGRFFREFLAPEMPLGDAIDLARFLVGVAIGYARIGPWPPLVGGDVAIAAITRDGGFRWVRRKQLYPPAFNPRADLGRGGDRVP